MLIGLLVAVSIIVVMTVVILVKQLSVSNKISTLSAGQTNLVDIHERDSKLIKELSSQILKFSDSQSMMTAHLMSNLSQSKPEPKNNSVLKDMKDLFSIVDMLKEGDVATQEKPKEVKKPLQKTSIVSALNELKDGVSYRDSLKADADKINYVVEGGTFVINMNKSDVPGNPSTLKEKFTSQLKVPIDTLIESIAITAFTDNPDNPGVGDCIPTDAFKINIKDNLSGDPWIISTGELPPVSLLFGEKPTQLPAPRPLYQNSLLELTIDPDVEIVDFVISFIGRRMDMLPEWERDKLCGDPRTQGACWIYFDPMVLTRGDSAADPCGRGPVSESTIRIPALPYDVKVNKIVSLCTGKNKSTSLNKAWYEYRLADMNNRKLLSEGFCSSINNSSYKNPLNTNVNWLIRNQGSIRCEARSAYSPLDSEQHPVITGHLLLHGRRVESSDSPYNRNSKTA